MPSAPSSTSGEQTLNKLGPLIYKVHFVIMAGFALAFAVALVSERRQSRAAVATRR